MSDVDVTREIAASPETVWGLVSDLPRMGEWSPENEGGEWIGDADGATVGAKFKGTNSSGRRSWKTVSTVTAADPGRRFAFTVKAAGLPISEWEFEIEPTDGGCRVTQRFTDKRPGFFKPIAAKVTGVSDRVTHNRDGMAATLDGLAATAETAG